MTEFMEFPKMARWSREIIITEKIDGTNACVFIGDDGEFLTGSRSRWITPEDDNFGFSRWAHEHKADLMTLGPGRHFGEWWGSGIQRGYGLLNGEKRFSLFNTARWCLAGATPTTVPTADPRVVKTQDFLPACCGLVPVLYRGPMAAGMVERCIEQLTLAGSSAAPGFAKPEGIVLFHVAANVGFKKTLIKDDVPKGRA